jgi:hypothetical protein
VTESQAFVVASIQSASTGQPGLSDETEMTLSTGTSASSALVKLSGRSWDVSASMNFSSPQPKLPPVSVHSTECSPAFRSISCVSLFL